MLSRSILMPRVASYARRFMSVNSMLAKQMPESDRAASSNKVDLKSFQKPTTTSTYKTKANFETNKVSLKEKLNNEVKSQKEMPTKIKNELKNDDKTEAKKLIDDLGKNFNKIEKLIPLIKRLNVLYEADDQIASLLKQQDFILIRVKTTILNKLNHKELSNEDFFTAINYLSNFESEFFPSVVSFIEEKAKDLNSDQLVNLLHLLRCPRNNAHTKQLCVNVMNMLKENISDLNEFKQILAALKLFGSDQVTIKKLDLKILQSSESLKKADWIDLLNTKSITRQRNSKIIESCFYNLSSCGNLSLGDVQKCLLSCGILNFHDETFYKFLIVNFCKSLAGLKKSEFDSNVSDLNSIIASIGMLMLRDETLVNTLAHTLVQFDAAPKILANFVISCAAVNLAPRNLSVILERIKIDDFKLNEPKNMILFLNYVWSRCVLNVPDKKLIAHVLNESFYSKLIADKAQKTFKGIILKLLNINVYACLFIENYDGPVLASEVNAGNFTEYLKNEKIKMSASFLATLSSYRSPEKYFKANLLTPFGIYIDAVMVLDENRLPCLINEYFNEDAELETKNPNELKIAFKLIDFNDMTKVDNQLRGAIVLQMKMLQELGYVPITINFKEMIEPAITKRVDMIKKKLDALKPLRK